MSDLNDILARRRARRQQSALTYYAVIGCVLAIGCVMLLVGVGYLVKRNRGNGGATPLAAVVDAVTGPSARSEGETWTYKELCDYLKSKGMDVRLVNTGGEIVFADSETEDSFVEGMIRQGYIVDGMLVVGKAKSGPIRGRTSAELREEVRQWEGSRNGGYGWGFFMFSGDSKMVDKVKEILR